MMEREHKEKKNEISNYYKQFNNREKEIRKENWRIGLKNYDREVSREENKNEEDFIQNSDVEDFSEKNLLEELYLFIECKVKELKKRERGKRGKRGKKDQRDMLQKEKNYKKKKLEYRKEDKESFN